MQFTNTSLLALGLYLLQSVSATATVSQCLVTHSNNGNTFNIQVVTVPNVSQSTICGHFNDHLESDSSRNGVTITSGLQCSTDASNMSGVVQLNKQSPQTQLETLSGALSEAFGSQGLNFDTSICNIGSIPAKLRMRGSTVEKAI